MMTLSELMEYMEQERGVIPSATFEGFSTADDQVLAINFENASDAGGYVVAQTGVTEASGKLTPENKEVQYIRTGKVSTKTGTSRTFAVKGDRYCSDPFQDAILAYALKFGTGQAVIKDYVYFDVLTGVGEKGKISISVDDDLAGAAGDTATWGATLSSTILPTKYEYTPGGP